MHIEVSVPSVQVGLLGALTLHVDGRPVDVPGSRRRILLAALALAPRRALSVPRLIDLIWPEAPPHDAVRAVYSHVSRLRRHLGPAGYRLTTHEAGYALDLSDDEVDARRVRRIADGLAGRPPVEVREATRQALALWRGPALDEFGGHSELVAAALSLTELRARLRDDLTQALLDLGEPAVADAQLAAAAQPLRERTALLLVRALAEEGRPAEAMESAADYRARLVDETGLDAGPALAALEQQVAAGAVDRAAEPPWASAARTLPRPTGPLVGRERDRDEVHRLLGEHRVVTLTGAGGVGKTRLALEVAAGFAHQNGIDAVFVDLAAVEDAARVPQAVGSTLLLRTADDLTAVGVARAVGVDARLLVVLDNCEHLVGACRELVDAVAGHLPDVRVLATSRVILGSRSEYVVRLQPLPLPAAGDRVEFRQQPSVRAFLEHARRRDRAFDLGPGDGDHLAALLRSLDGLPLAIEIAAGQAVLMPLATLRDRLALDLASPSEPSDDARQATLRTTVEWSFTLLDTDARSLLLALAPFPGGVDLGTLEQLADEVVPGQDPLRLLRRLVDASLLDVDPDRSRYRLLFTVRSFLLDRLRFDDAIEPAQERFVRHLRNTAVEIGAGLFGETEALADRRLHAELPNLRAARDLARETADLDAVAAITLALDVPSIWRDISELWAWCLELAEETGIERHPRATEILGAAAEAARLAGAYERAVELARRGLALGGSAAEQARSESALAGVALYRGEFTSAADGWSRAAAAVDTAVRPAYLASAALASAYAVDLPTAARQLARATTLAEATGCAGNQAFVHYVEGELLSRHDPDAAVARYQAAIAQASSVGAGFVVGVASVALASARTRGGDRSAAAVAFAELLHNWQTTGQGPQLWTTARNAAALLLAEGRTREAVLLTVHADRSPDAAAVDAAGNEPGFGPSGSDELERLRGEAAAMSDVEVIAAARRALLELGRDDSHPLR